MGATNCRNCGSPIGFKQYPNSKNWYPTEPNSDQRHQCQAFNSQSQQQQAVTTTTTDNIASAAPPTTTKSQNPIGNSRDIGKCKYCNSLFMWQNSKTGELNSNGKIKRRAYLIDSVTNQVTDIVHACPGHMQELKQIYEDRDRLAGRGITYSCTGCGARVYRSYKPEHLSKLGYARPVDESTGQLHICLKSRWDSKTAAGATPN